MNRSFLTGGSLVLADRVLGGHTLVVEDGHIVEIASGPRSVSPGEVRVDAAGCYVLPGFIDVHVHGASGIDVLDGPGSVAAVARELPRWGVTAFCPTSVACPPPVLAAFLDEVANLRATKTLAGARVLPAHLESNFINPEFKGAQPGACLRVPSATTTMIDGFSTGDILGVIERRRPDVGIVTLAPEIDGGLALVRSLAAAGVSVSLGHSGATFAEAQAAIAAGARRATHLFNRMRPMTHREPGLAGAVLADADVAVELICDGHHVHPAVLRVAIGAKMPARVLAITDGTAASGLAPGAKARLGGQPITVAEVAKLDDGTTAGSVATMDRVFRTLVGPCGFDVVEAAHMTSTTPARELGLVGYGVITAGSVADLVVLDSQLQVRTTLIGGLPGTSDRRYPS